MGQEGEEEAGYEMAKTCVWWDIDNCAVPKGCNANAIAKNISSALANRNYRGPVSISAYGDTHRIPAPVQQALTSTGVSIHHVPTGVKDASDKKILVRMLLWAVENPPPANYFLISGDRDFSDALHQLRMKRYNILLAQPQKASAPLVAAAKTVWLWTTLVAGGPPLDGGESEQFASNRRSSISDSQQIPVPDAVQTQQAVNSSAHNPSGTGKSPTKTTGNGIKYRMKATRRKTGETETSIRRIRLFKAKAMPNLSSSKFGEASANQDDNDYLNIFGTSSSFENPSTWQPQKHGSEEYTTQNMSSASHETMRRRYYDFPEHLPSSTSGKLAANLANAAERVERGALRPSSIHKHTQDVDPALAVVIILFVVALWLIYSQQTL